MVVSYPLDAIIALMADGKVFWQGNVTANTTLSINQPGLFGGDKKEGGISGSLDIMMGGASQTANTYLQGILGSVPAYRGVTSLVMRKMYIAAMSPYPKPWSITGRYLPASIASAYSNINSGSANAAIFMYECLTHQIWGAGISTARINTASFIAAAQTLHGEGFGISLGVFGQTTFIEIIIMMLSHVNGVLYSDLQTGQLTLKLIRGDYDINTVLNLNQTNIHSVDSFERSAIGEMVNEVVVRYRPRGATEDSAVTAQDLASIQAQGAVVSQTVNYPGVDTEDNALRVAMRDVRQTSTPLAKVTLKVGRIAYTLKLGSVFTWTWPEYGIVLLPMRVININFGSLTQGVIEISAVQDVFGLPSTTYLGLSNGSLWLDPVGAPLPAVGDQLKEVPFWDLRRQLFGDDALTTPSTSTYLYMFAALPAVFSTNFEAWVKPFGGSYAYLVDGAWSPSATIVEALSYTTTVCTLSSLNVLDYDLTTFAGTYAVINGTELVGVVSYNSGTQQLTLHRGVLDTVPLKHAAGATILFIDGANGSAAYSREEYLQGETVYGKALTSTGVGLLPLASATERTVVLVGRHALPYPPGNFRVNGTVFLEYIRGNLTVAWSHRDRLDPDQEFLISFTTGDIGPEVGTTYNLVIYAEDLTTVLVTQTGLTGTTYTYSTETPDGEGFLNNRLRVVLYSVRDTLSSYTRYDQIITRVGYGYSYGAYYGGG